MVKIKVRKAHLENGAFAQTAINFGVSYSGVPPVEELKEAFESIFDVDINGSRMHSFISNAVNEDTMFFKGEICFPRSCV